MTIGMRPEGLLICPWQPAGERHEIKWVAAAFDTTTTEEIFRCETCPRVLRVIDGVIGESEPGREVVIRMSKRHA